MRAPVDFPRSAMEMLTEMYQPTVDEMAERLGKMGWTYFQSEPLSQFLKDPTGMWVCKINMHPDHGYEYFADVIAGQPNLLESCKHLPQIIWHRKVREGLIPGVELGGSITLMECLQPMVPGTSRLRALHDKIVAVAKIETDHQRGLNRVQEGRPELMKQALGQDYTLDLLRLSSLLGALSTLSYCRISAWSEGDVMVREDGTEVLIDPFNRHQE